MTTLPVRNGSLCGLLCVGMEQSDQSRYSLSKRHGLQSPLLANGLLIDAIFSARRVPQPAYVLFMQIEQAAP
jgi:hypothetical protein